MDEDVADLIRKEDADLIREEEVDSVIRGLNANAVYQYPTHSYLGDEDKHARRAYNKMNSELHAIAKLIRLLRDEYCAMYRELSYRPSDITSLGWKNLIDMVEAPCVWSFYRAADLHPYPGGSYQKRPAPTKEPSSRKTKKRPSPVTSPQGGDFVSAAVRRGMFPLENVLL